MKANLSVEVVPGLNHFSHYVITLSHSVPLIPLSILVLSLPHPFSSVHLCNNSIQKHLRPSQLRHGGIPADNMWSDDQFKTFLSSQGREGQWQDEVVPGMKKAVIHALQTTQDLMDSRKNTFELYGADFMLGRMQTLQQLLQQLEMSDSCDIVFSLM